MADRRRPRTDRATSPGDRATSPMVAKSLEAAVVVLFIGVVTTGLYAGIVPDYRSVTSAEVGDRTLAAAGHEIERTVPPAGESVAVERRVELPTTIRSEPYRVVAAGGDAGDANGTGSSEGSGEMDDTSDGTRIELRHPHPAVEGSRALSLPERVVDVRGEIAGGGGWIVVSSDPDGGIVVTLTAERQGGRR